MDSSPSPIAVAAGVLNDAVNRGRPIIPIVGAGISAESGFPVIESLVRYLGKLKAYISQRIWLPDGKVQDKRLEELAAGFDAKPWDFAEQIGWPDRFALTEALVQADKGRNRSWVSNAVREALDKLLTESHGGTKDWFKRFEEDVLKLGKQASSAADFQSVLDRFDHTSDGRSTAWDLFGDWRRLLLYFTSYKSDLADTLFDRFARNRLPNLGHHYLAFLIRRLNVSVIFTMNFDPFIEQALGAEGLQPRIFAMERGLTLPHDALVRDQLAVIKMHGSTHGLLLDEQLDRPLGPDYLGRFTKIVGGVGKSPLLLVVGCSGDDNRLIELTSQAISSSAKARATQTDAGPAAVWLHYGSTRPKRVEALASQEFGSSLITFVRTNSVSGTLQHLYSRIDKLHPASKNAYVIHSQQPVVFGDIEKKAEIIEKLDDEEIGKVIELFSKATKRLLLLKTFDATASATPHGAGAATTYPDVSASRALLTLASACTRKGQLLIWVDLESLHSLSAVVSSIIEQCRKYDPELPASVLSTEDQGVLKSAIPRVARALRRARYFVAVDGLETYLWSPTAHHGDTRLWTRETELSRLRMLIKFLIELSRQSLGETLLAVSIDAPKARTNSHASEQVASTLRRTVSIPDTEANLTDLEAESNLVRFKTSPAAFEDRFYKTGSGLHCPYFKLKASETSDFLEARPDGRLHKVKPGYEGSWSMALSILAIFRRTRPLPLVYQVLRPFLGASTDAFLEWGNGEIWEQIEGGGIWFYRELRDHVYSGQICHTGAAAMDAFRQGNDLSNFEAAVFQLLHNSCVHQFVARAWYADAFLESSDTYALMEYLYHRTSGVRSLTKLLWLLEKDGVGTQVRDALRKFKALIHEASQNGDFLAGYSSDRSALEAFELHEGFFTVPDKNGVPDLADLRAELVSRHKEEILRLERAWKRSESLLRSRLPAEQLVRWCRQFLEDDLRFRFHGVVTQYRPDGNVNDSEVGAPPMAAGGVVTNPLELSMKPPRGDKEPLEGWAPTKRLSKATQPPNRIENLKHRSEGGAIWHLRNFVQDFLVKVLIDRSDYQQCIKLREAIPPEGDDLGVTPDHQAQPSECDLWAGLVSGKLQIEGRSPDSLSISLRDRNRAIDICSCKLRLAQRDTSTVAALREALKEVETELCIALPAGRPYLHDEFAAGSHEVMLRRLHVLTDSCFARIAVFSHNGFDGELVSFPEFEGRLDRGNHTTVERLDHLEQLVNDASRLARLQARSRTAILHSPIVNSVTDGTLYLQYRGIFLIQRARLCWMSAVHRAVNASAEHSIHFAFDDALRLFDSARAGLDDRNELTIALADLHGTEACLAHARLTLHPGASAVVLTCPDRFGLVKNRHETARQLLARARQSLLRSQRNVVWQRLFFQLTAQYQADRVLMGVVNSFRGRPRTIGFYLSRLSRGFEALSSAQNLYLDVATENLVWLQRIQWELVLGAFALGNIALTSGIRETGKELEKSSTWRLESSQVEYLMTNLVRLLRSGGVAGWNERSDDEAKSVLRDRCQNIADALAALEVERQVAIRSKIEEHHRVSKPVSALDAAHEIDEGGGLARDLWKSVIEESKK